jgi:hypothetical protein
MHESDMNQYQKKEYNYANERMYPNSMLILKWEFLEIYTTTMAVTYYYQDGAVKQL